MATILANSILANR